MTRSRLRCSVVPLLVAKLAGASYLAFTVLIFSAFGLRSLSSREAGAQTACGGLNQRDCCWLERNGPTWDGGLVEKSGCSGDCRCAGSLASSSGTYRLSDIKPCGGEAFERSQGACDGGLKEKSGCSGDCHCGNLLSSSGTCRRKPDPPVVIAPCGGEGHARRRTEHNARARHSDSVVHYLR